MNIVIGTGWCASAQGRCNTRASSRLHDPDFLTCVWRPYIERFVRPRAYSIFQSRCDVLPHIDLPDQRISLSPGIFTEAVAKAIASRRWIQWKDGLKIYNITMTLEGINLEIGDRVYLQCSDPDIDTVIEIYDIQFVPDSFLVEVVGFDTQARPEKYAVIEDTSQRRGYADEGYMAW